MPRGKLIIVERTCHDATVHFRHTPSSSSKSYPPCFFPTKPADVVANIATTFADCVGIEPMIEPEIPTLASPVRMQMRLCNPRSTPFHPRQAQT